MCKTAHIDEFAEKPARQINEMNALVDQLSAPDFLRLGAPFVGVTGPAAVSIAGPKEQQGTQTSCIDQVSCLAKGPMIPVIETHADTHIMVGQRGPASLATRRRAVPRVSRRARGFRR